MTTEVVTPKTEAEIQAAAVAVAEKSRADALAAGETPKDAIVPDPDAIPARPEGVPEKFYDAKTGQVDMTAWGKAHTDLETKFHEKPKTDEEKAAETAAAAKAAEDAAANPVASAQAEYAEKGELSDATYTALAAGGMDRTTVDAYIAGQKSAASANDAVAHEAAGSPEKYVEMVTWAAENLSEAEVEAYNLQVNSKNPEVVKAAAAALSARFAENVTIDADTLGGAIQAASSGTFESKAEMTAAMSKPSETVPGKSMYEIDPAYRAAVQKKISASRKAGKNIFI